MGGRQEGEAHQAHAQPQPQNFDFKARFDALSLLVSENQQAIQGRGVQNIRN